MRGMSEESSPVFVLACLACGKTVSGSEDRCPRCGASFEDMCFECPFCGEIVSAVQTKCDECGTEFSVFAEAVEEAASAELDGPEAPAATAEAAAVYECPACGKPVGEKDEACPHCGARFTE
jgi:rubrerythrin